MRRKAVRAALIALTALTLALVGTTTPAVAGTEITIQGIVQAGAEAGCLVMTPNSTGIPVTYLLLGGDPKVVVVGARLEVTGNVLSGSTTCQQGTPLQVISAKPI